MPVAVFNLFFVEGLFESIQLVVSSDLPPRLDSGRKKGYMYVMKELWDDLGYGELGLTAQNLRDQAARLEKSLGSIKGTMDRQIWERK